MQNCWHCNYNNFCNKFYVFNTEYMSKVFILLIMTVPIILMSCGTNTNSKTIDKHEPTKNQQVLLDKGWIFNTPKDGDLPENYGVKSIYGTQDNYFDIKMGADYDLVVKIMNCQTNKCIRYVYIPNNITTTVQDIPQGQYYLKLSYGNDWMTISTDDSTQGKFTKNVVYERGKNIFDFGRKNSLSNVSYQLEIKMENHILTKTFETDEITEKEFFE